MHTMAGCFEMIAKCLNFEIQKFLPTGFTFWRDKCQRRWKATAVKSHDNAVWNCTEKSFTSWFSWNRDMVHRLEHLQNFHRPLLTNFLQCFLQGQLCRCTGAKLWLWCRCNCAKLWFSCLWPKGCGRCSWSHHVHIMETNDLGEIGLQCNEAARWRSTPRLSSDLFCNCSHHVLWHRNTK